MNPTKASRSGRRAHKIGRPTSWKHPGALRMVALMQQAIDEGRSFTLEIDAEGATRVEIGPILPHVVRVRTVRKRLIRPRKPQ